MKLSIVIPCYNEEKNVFEIYHEIKTTLKKIKDYEMIFINDGSKDNTFLNLKKICNNTKENVQIINFSRNFGKESAMYAGLKMSCGEYVSIIDADMQQDPKLILQMVEFLDNHTDYDSVAMYQAKRIEGKCLTFFKNSFYKMMNKMSEIHFVQGASDFRTFRRCMVDSILEMGEYHRFSKGIFSWVGYNTYYMPYEVKKRENGKSSWSFWKLLKYAIEGIVSFSTVPLRLATVIGIVTFLISLFYFLFLVIQKFFFAISISGYAILVVLILLLGGLQLFSLGILGEYVARNYLETKKRPIYIAKDIISSTKHPLNQNQDKI